jgi:hypothetical protein
MCRPARLALLLTLLIPAARAAAQAQEPAAGDGVREAWDAIYVGDSKVGHVHLWIKPVKDSRGRELLNVRVDSELSFRRGPDTARMKLLYGTIETQEGEVLRLDTLTEASGASGQRIRAFGDVIDGKMTLTLESGGQRQQAVIPWGADVRGPYGAELSLSREPMQPGQAREVKTFIPDLNKVCLTKLRSVDFEEIPLGPKAEKHRLLRIESSIAELDGKEIPALRTTFWVDDSGQIMKTATSLLPGMYMYRTTKAAALAPAKSPFRLLEGSIIAVRRPIPNPERTRAITYRMKGADVATLFPNDQRQAVRPEATGSVLLDVRSDGPKHGQPAAKPAEDRDLRPNPLIDSADSLVVQRMREAVGNRRDPWEQAVAIQDWVFRSIRGSKKNFTTGFAPAAEVARDLTGDCTEHAVLTAAMCRAAGIPSRCAVGLVYAENISNTGKNGFGPHMWTEVFVNGRWVAIDAAFNQSQVDATHIKLADTSLDGVAPFEAMLPVLQVFQGLTIEPVEVR